MNLLKSLRALKEEDHRRALYASLVFIMLMILFFLLVSLEEPDPPLQEKIIAIEMEDFELPEPQEDTGGGGSDGGPNPDYSETVAPAPNVVTQTETSVSVNSGNSNQTNNGNNNTQPQPDQSLGFNGNSGNNNGDGDGDGFGDGDGVGNSNGTDGGNGTYNPNRKVTTAPTFNGQAQEEGKIALDLWVDENGTVVQVRFKESKSTSGSAYLINLATKAAKTMKYDKKPGAVKEHVGYQVFEFKKI